MANVVKSIQQVSITIAAAASSNTATINSVTTSKTILIFQGITDDRTSAGGFQNAIAYITLTNATTITATRSGTTDTIIVLCTAIEFVSGVNSIQAGTISLSTIQASNTATISAVGANAFVLWQGASINATAAPGGGTSAVALTNSTTVTASIGAASLGGTPVIGYMVADLDTTIISSVQAFSHTDLTSASSYTDTITSVTTTSAMVVYNGMTFASPSTTDEIDAFHTVVLTNATTVTMTRQGTAVTGRTILYTVVQLAAGALKSNIQRGTISFSASNSGTATITSVNTSYSFANWNNFNWAGTGNDVPAYGWPNLTLTNATTVTSSTNTAPNSTANGAVVLGYEIVEFLPPPFTVVGWEAQGAQVISKPIARASGGSPT